MRTSAHAQRSEQEKLKIEIHKSAEAAGEAAAQASYSMLRGVFRREDTVALIFATGSSQLHLLRSLTSLPEFPWNKVQGFHMDEYIGLPPDHVASFRRYMRENLCQRVPIKQFHEIDGTSPDPEAVCREYACRLRSANPQLCFLGIGENGHLAFNDPGEADFKDSKEMKIVTLDSICQQQQVAEGWFSSLAEVPEQALTLTIPALLSVPRLIVSVPGPRKAEIMRRVIEEPVSTACPATVLKMHPNVTVYLDCDSASQLEMNPSFLSWLVP